MTGLSPRNLAYMRIFAAVYPDRQIVQQAVAQIASGHNLSLKDFLKLADHRLWHDRQVNKHGWSRAVIAFGAALVQR
jgi:predicted nuclease of restriction endonuclease-like (RecB) superfamily